jgi:selenocysteine lyase/cysteine desulfurase
VGEDRPAEHAAATGREGRLRPADRHGRKFLRGPWGTGFLWVRTAALEKLDPFVTEIGSATWGGHQGRAGVNVSTTVPEDNLLDTLDRGVHPLIRFSPHYYNTDEEIDRTTELVAGLAR